MKTSLHLVGYLHRCTKMMHGHTNVNFIKLMVYSPTLRHENTDGQMNETDARVSSSF